MYPIFYKLKIGNKGLSAVEVVITFTLVAVISVSLLNVVMSYKDRQETESYKQEIITFKNTVTQVLQDDATKYMIKKVKKIKRADEGLGQLCKSYDPDDPNTSEIQSKNETLNIVEYEISFILTDIKKTLTIDRLNNTITYPDLDSNGNLVNVKYTLPDIGTSKSERVGKYKCTNIKSLRISDIYAKEENGFFILDINLYHNKMKLGNKYGIHVIAPINFT